jgi:predicted Rossmann fold flavoprotein
MNSDTTIIIGAGASGLMAANQLAMANKKVILLEKKQQMGLKLRITGKGRCNLTNDTDEQTFLSHVSNADFFLPSFRLFSNRDLMDFFSLRDVELKTERGGRVYPLSNKSNDIFFALLRDIEHNDNVDIRKNTEVKHLIIDNGRVIGVVANNERLLADNVIICTGGKTYPTTGSTGDGYRILEKIDHKIVRPIPVLVGLRTQDGYPRELQDEQIKNCQAIISNAQGEVIDKQFGDLYLDEFGVSGPIILSLSRRIARQLDKGETMFVTVDFKPKVDKTKLYEEIIQTFQTRRTENASSILRKWLPKSLITHALQTCQINGRTMGYKLREEDAKHLLWYLKNRKEEIVGDMGWREAVVTMGGVSLNEVNKFTMQSRKVRNLYITGELLDLDADTGGYNLQIAFSTAVMAAQDIIKK